MEHQFKEAFCLMYYENEETKTGFVIWNSRNGVTPFIVFEEGKEYVHKHWGMDVPVTNQRYINQEILKPGQRIFRDTTEDEAREAAKNRIKSFEGTEYQVEEGSARWLELVDSLTKDFAGDPCVRKVVEKGVMP